MRSKPTRAILRLCFLLQNETFLKKKVLSKNRDKKNPSSNRVLFSFLMQKAVLRLYSYALAEGLVRFRVNEKKQLSIVFSKCLTETRRNETRLCRVRISTMFREERSSRSPKKSKGRKQVPAFCLSIPFLFAVMPKCDSHFSKIDVVPAPMVNLFILDVNHIGGDPKHLSHDRAKARR